MLSVMDNSASDKKDGIMLIEKGEAIGVWEVRCIRRGKEIWRVEFPNVVTIVGKNLLLDSGLAGSSYTVVGPYIGLISATSYSAVSIGDTMGSHGGWLEAGAAHLPHYSGPRKTAAWSVAAGGAKSFSSAANFGITSTGPDIVKGAFLLYGSGALNTIDDTNGVLYSAGLFVGGDQPVVSTDTLLVNYNTSL